MSSIAFHIVGDAHQTRNKLHFDMSLGRDNSEYTTGNFRIHNVDIFPPKGHQLQAVSAHWLFRRCSWVVKRNTNWNITSVERSLCFPIALVFFIHSKQIKVDIIAWDGPQLDNSWAGCIKIKNCRISSLIAHRYPTNLILQKTTIICVSKWTQPAGQLRGSSAGGHLLL